MSALRPEPMDSSWISMMSISSSLKKEHFDPYNQPFFLKPAAKFLSLLGKKAVISLVEKGVKNAGIPPNKVVEINTNKIASIITERFKPINKKSVPFVSIGAPSGAISYLTSLFNGVFLSQHLLFSFRHTRDPDDTKATYYFGKKLVEKIVENNDDLQVINHYDPLHDRFLVKHVNHIRTKFLGLPLPYEIFLSNYLTNEAPILISDVSYSWLQFDMGVKERGWFQVGGLGGYSDKEFLKLPEEVKKWLLMREGKKIEGWFFEEMGDPVLRRESEWGFETEMKEKIIEWGRENGHPVYVMETKHPEIISQNLLKAELRNKNIKKILFSAFIAIDPLFTQFTEASAYWLPFICEDSFMALKGWISKNKELFNNVEKIGLVLSPNFTNPPDTVKLSNWIELLENIAPVKLLGIDEKRYPFDLYSLFNFKSSVKKFAKNLKFLEVKNFDFKSYFSDMNNSELLIKEK